MSQHGTPAENQTFDDQQLLQTQHMISQWAGFGDRLASRIQELNTQVYLLQCENSRLRDLNRQLIEEAKK